MKQLRYFFAIVASALLMIACQEDFAGDITPNNGTLKVRFEVPTLDNVEITRGAVEETEAYDVMLYIFDSNGDLVDHPYDIVLTPTNENNYTRKYEVDTKINIVKEGTYDVYAIANTESNSLWQGIAAFNEVETKTEFEALALTLNTIENTSKRMTLSGHATFTASADVQLAVDIQLSRPYAKVTFNVKSGSVNKNFKFTPTSYDIINVPTAANMFANTNVESSGFKDYTSRAIPQSGSFEFIQLENTYDVVAGPAKYTDREKRNSDSDRAFKYAPKNSTYVVIYGEGVETDDDGHTIKISKTNYTIHLGDFSPTGKMGDYSIKRNTHYTYNVTVNGVNMIEVEAKRETADYENGAEGYVIDMSKAKQVYNLDAHYETVLLKLDITNIAFGEDVSTVSGLTMSVSSPLMEDKDKNVSVSWKEIQAAINGGTLNALYGQYDAQWVEFMPVERANFAVYKSAPMFHVCEFLNEIFKEKTTGNSALTIHKENDIDYIYVVAFINEYFYEGKPLTDFVNKPDREMKILQSPQVSTDGHSVYSEALCAFSQKSISTMFDLSSTANIYGIESYDETGLMRSTENLAGSDNTNGWANMKSYLSNASWSYYVNNGGYSYDGQPNGNTLNVLRNQDAAYACMQRNRDLDGNSSITDDEIRWYVPAYDQLCAFWYGEESLPTYARLYQGSTTDVKSHNEHKSLNHIFSSSGDSHRVFFAIEGTSHNKYPYNNVNENYTRCVRNLKEVTGAPTPTASRDGNVIYVNNFVELAYRSTIQNGPYPEHHERETPNKLPHAFKVASRNLNDDDLKNGNGDVLPTLNHVIEAPNISSAVSRDGKTTLTFADLVTDGTIGYYYTTDNTAAQTNRIDAVNNQFTIEEFVLVDGDGKTYSAPNIDIAATTATVNTIDLKFASVEDGVTYSYSTSETGTKTPFTITNNEFTINYNYSYSTSRTTFDVWIWATKDDTSLYTQVRITRAGSRNNYTYTPSINSKQADVTTGNPPTVLYIWAYDQAVRDYSNATIVTASGVQIGEDKVVSEELTTVPYASDNKRYNPKRDKLRLAATTMDLCAGYQGDNDPSDAPKWRVPNQRELTLINDFENEEDAFGMNVSTIAYFSSTKYSNAVYASSGTDTDVNGNFRYSYVIEAGGSTYGGVFSLVTISQNYAIRCVRDLAPSEINGSNPPTDSDGGYEGTAGIN